MMLFKLKIYFMESLSAETQQCPAGIYLLKVDNRNTRTRHEYVQN